MFKEMTKELLAETLNGREYRQEISKEEAKLAEQHGLVVVFGASDDLMEFEGAIYDEFGCWDGGTALVDGEGMLKDREQIDDDEELEKWFNRKKEAKTITSLWCKETPYSWVYETDIPHVTFDIMEDGEKYCRGIVFELKELKSKI